MMFHLMSSCVRLWSLIEEQGNLIISQFHSFPISIFFQAAGVALAYVGSYVIKSYKNFEDFVADKYNLIPAAIIIGVAVVMFVIGILGCCATLKESKVGLGFVSVDLLWRSL